MDLWVFDNDGTLYDDRLAHLEFAKQLSWYLAWRLGLWQEEEQASLLKRIKLVYQTSSSVIALKYELDCAIKEVIEETYMRLDLDSCQIPKEDSKRYNALAQIKGRKVVLTNNPSAFARKVLNRVGLAAHFDDIVGMEETGLILKPDPEAFIAVMRRHPDATRVFLCDDSLENLDAAVALGWKTVWYQPDRDIDQGDRTHLVAHSFEEVARIAILM
ncbi:MAG TPA: HAD-IA family hydrolase [Candidatus Paceibacterota bacterium]